MIIKYVFRKKPTAKQLSRKQSGFFDFGVGLGLFLLFAGTSAVITANENSSTAKNEVTNEVVVAQDQSSKSDRYAFYDTDC